MSIIAPAAVALVSHRVLFVKDGENWTTPASPIRAYSDADEALLSVKDTFCVSFDNDMLVQGNKYEVHEVVLPAFLSVKEWLSAATEWKYTWGAGVDPTWPEAWQRGISALGSFEDKLACAKLLTTKSFRSEFRKSIRDQLVAWLETPAESRKYKNPFSPRQWDKLVNVYVAREANAISEGLYRNRHYRGVPRKTA
jgi:hypothetical protein